MRIDSFDFMTEGRPWTKVTMELYHCELDQNHAARTLADDSEPSDGCEPVVVESYETQGYVLTHLPTPRRTRSGRWRIVDLG